MNPFYFGSSERPLYGVHHPPRERNARESGVVLCYPMGQEYMRSHRAFRQLANLLTRKGHHVFRFDYFATGDSAGASGEGSLAQWVADVHLAIDELKDNASLESVSLVGLRLGAALAARASGARRDIDRLVLWDPVVNGRSYLGELYAAAGETKPRNGAAPATLGVLGFPLVPALADEIAELDLLERDGACARSVEIVVSAEREEYQGLRDRLAGRGLAIEYACVPSPGNWNEVDNFGSALLPQQLIQEIVARFAKEKP
ncbi:MAG TPA: alpha/beta hydrolase [Myxococcota bacterium]|jgi:dienelactone hydrolase